MSGMTIGQFESLCIENPDLKVNFAPYESGSWRGVYAEGCIFVHPDGESYLSEMLPFIADLKTGAHYGYKGGEYEYNDDTPLNFEPESSVWSDGDFFQRMLLENPNFAEIVARVKAHLGE